MLVMEVFLGLATSSIRMLRQMNSETAVDMYVNSHSPASQADVAAIPRCSSIANQQDVNMPDTGTTRTTRQVRRMTLPSASVAHIAGMLDMCSLSFPAFVVDRLQFEGLGVGL